MIKKYKWLGAFFGVLLTILIENALDVSDRVFNYFDNKSISQEIKEFSERSYIKSVESKDGKTRITYSTCQAPKIDYNIAVTVNGDLKFESPVFKSIRFGSDYTDKCITFTGKAFNFELVPGDKLVIIWDYGKHGSFEMVYNA